jgi:peptidyl-prolyl cis-trans isomerase A (cyclophilin A)
VPDSATSQFFINVVDNAMLNHPQPDGHGYAVFGKVVQGMDTVTAIKSVKTTSTGMHRDVPAEQVVIQSVTRVGAK